MVIAAFAPSRPGSRVWVSSAWVAAVVLAGAGLVSGLLMGPAPEWVNLTPRPIVILFALVFILYASVGAVVVARADNHPIGWLFLVSGGLYALGLAGGNLAKQRFLDGHVEDEFSAYASWVSVWSWEMAAALLMITLVLFPHRRPHSRASAVLVTLLAVNGAFQFAALALRPGELDGGSHPDNPFGIGPLDGLLRAAVFATEAISWALLLAALVMLLVRFRRATGDERRHLRWLTFAMTAFLVTLAGSVVGSAVGDYEIQVVPFFVELIAIPIAMAVSIVKDRLYDIELVINRVLVYVFLVALVTGVYIAAVLVTRATFVGRDAPSSTPAVMALVAVGLGLAPARDRLQRLADRLVFGHRATPYNALASFAEHSAGSWTIGDTAPRLAGVLSDATGAAAVVYVRAEDELIPIAREPRSPENLYPIALIDLDNELARYSHSQLVERRGEVLGALALTMPPGRAVRAGERRVVRQLAAQAALSFETLRHAAALAEHAAELHRSRLRLVQVQDAERQRIGRDLHDGAQQHLLAILAKAGMARSQMSRDLAVADGTIEELQQDTRAVLAEIREFVHGIFPQILADRGLVVAVQQRAARLPVPVVVECDREDMGRRFDRSIESAAWFVVSEALTNVLKHAQAQQVTVRMRVGDSLEVEVIDDGVGLRDGPAGHGLTNMSDRVAALEGSLVVESAPAGGTAVRCTLPLAPPAAE